ncbi:MBL fold metallo-hydrolase [Dermatobacter hominis]|uniref:MBL fold metallo-hydrolase n=1 Tax=Dermatobacter hominis TaxID=2884263 RepID=UPI001D0F9E99|nr:MBL fold metallo-hydrolase [Dermatobacter hominis]UDY35249.1 MBL fold metallo-hydrolase [Dermatobacter hominis]
MALRFLTEFDPEYGRAVDVSPGLVRVVAENPSKYTAWGTGTYLVGDGEVAVIDPGPDLAPHVEAVLAALDGRRVTHVLVTHTHADHSPAARAISRATGAPTYGFGPHPPEATSGDADTRSPAGGEVDATDAADEVEVDESGDREFVPDVAVRDGDVLEGDGFRFECLHTPGHISNHVCYAEGERGLLFPGDHVMGWSTTVVSPPDGDMAAYVAGLRRLVDRREDGRDGTYLPTHGPPITDPGPYVAALVDHRLERDRQILELLDGGTRTVDELVAVMYADVRPELHAPAGRSVLAHLLALERAGLVEEADPAGWRPVRTGGSLGS